MRNTDEQRPVVLEGVTLGSSDAAPPPELRESYIVRAESDLVYGGGLEMPPHTEGPEQRELWEMREELVGAEIGPGESVLILLGAHPTDEGAGSSEWFEISYKLGNSPLTHRTPEGIAFDPSPDC